MVINDRNGVRIKEGDRIKILKDLSDFSDNETAIVDEVVDEVYDKYICATCEQDDIIDGYINEKDCIFVEVVKKHKKGGEFRL